MDEYAVHLAIAAIAGASVVAISAYFMHRKTLAQILEFARSMEKERDRVKEKDAKENSTLLEESAGNAGGMYHYKRRNHLSRRRIAIGRTSASLPDVTVARKMNGTEGEERGIGSDAEVVSTEMVFKDDDDDDDYYKGMGVPPGLPKVQTFPKGTTFKLQLMVRDFTPE